MKELKIMDMQDVSRLVIPEGEVKAIHDKNGKLLWGRVAYDVKYAGDMFQQNYSGKNLFDIYGDFTHTAGYTTGSTTKNSNGTITATGNYTQGRGPGQKIDNLEQNTDYTLTVTLDSSTSTSTNYAVAEALSGTSSLGKMEFKKTSGYPNTLYITFTTPQDTSDIWISFSTWGNNVSATFSSIQLEKGSSSTSYEPYTGRIPSTNPNFPEPISVVTGEQLITVESDASQQYKINLGKNLFDVNSITENTGANTNGVEGHEVTFSSNSGRAVELIKVEPNSSYVLSIGDTDVVNRIFIVGMKNATIESGHSFGWTWSNGKIKTGSKDRYLLLVLSVVNSQGGTVSNVSKANIQIEKGVSATQYVSYITPVELRRLGGASDYIYKSGGDWYLHKEIGSYTLTSSGDYGKMNFSNLSGWSYYYTTVLDGMVMVGNDSSISNIFRRVSSVLGINEQLRPGLFNDYHALPVAPYMSLKKAASTDTNILRISLPNSVVASVDQFKDWIKNNEVTIYYIMATPTDTQITDNTLISQLESVHQFLTRYGYSATVSGDLPIIIDKTNL